MISITTVILVTLIFSFAIVGIFMNTASLLGAFTRSEKIPPKERVQRLAIVAVAILMIIFANRITGIVTSFGNNYGMMLQKERVQAAGLGICQFIGHLCFLGLILYYLVLQPGLKTKDEVYARNAATCADCLKATWAMFLAIFFVILPRLA